MGETVEVLGAEGARQGAICDYPALFNRWPASQRIILQILAARPTYRMEIHRDTVGTWLSSVAGRSTCLSRNTRDSQPVNNGSPRWQDC
jgi:hypothetical protein